MNLTPSQKAEKLYKRLSKGFLPVHVSVTWHLIRWDEDHPRSAIKEVVFEAHWKNPCTMERNKWTHSISWEEIYHCDEGVLAQMICPQMVSCFYKIILNGMMK